MVDGVATPTTDTIGNKNLAIIERCTQLRGFWYIAGRHSMHNQAVEHNRAVFSELSFFVRWQGRLVLQVTVLI